MPKRLPISTFAVSSAVGLVRLLAACGYDSKLLAAPTTSTSTSTSDMSLVYSHRWMLERVTSHNNDEDLINGAYLELGPSSMRGFDGLNSFSAASSVVDSKLILDEPMIIGAVGCAEAAKCANSILTTTIGAAPSIDVSASELTLVNGFTRLEFRQAG